MRKLVSILMPTYNRAGMISNAIKSILLQTYQNFEFIIYDDGSTDNTEDIVNKFNSDKIQYIKFNKNKGCAWARNHMLDICNGEIACWQDSDDISNIYRIERQVKAIEKSNHIVATGFKWLHKANKNEWKTKPRLGGKMAHASVMFKIENVLKVDLKLSGGGSDADWLRRMRKKFEPYIILDEVLYYARMHKDRIGMWKRKAGLNPKWSARMAAYKKSI